MSSRLWLIQLWKESPWNLGSTLSKNLIWSNVWNNLKRKISIVISLWAKLAHYSSLPFKTNLSTLHMLKHCISIFLFIPMTFIISMVNTTKIVRILWKINVLNSYVKSQKRKNSNEAHRLFWQNQNLIWEKFYKSLLEKNYNSCFH